MSWKSVLKFVAPAVLAVAIAAPTVQAADLGGRDRYRSVKDEPDYGPPRYLWTGLYIGAQAGYGWGDGRLANALADSGSFDIDGFIGGGTLGYNLQSGQIVFGLETDFSFTDIQGSSNVAPCAPGACTSSMDWLWTLRGRIGLDMNGWMPYFTGGLAMADVSSRVIGLTAASDTLTGWTVGGGLEVKMDRNWSLKAEYLYVDLGNITLPNGAFPIRSNFDELHVVRAGLNYKF